jgi:serine/threonine-protein phosphatase 2A regulatory subunit A
MSIAHTPTPSLTMARSLPQGVDELASMGPFELFRSQMEAGSAEAKVDAMKRLGIVACAMGADSTLANLIPYLSNVAMKQPPHEDELLLLLSSELKGLVPNLLNNAVPLLPIFERLAAVEETVVRDEAVKGLNHVMDYIKETNLLVAMAKRLVAADWFTPKVSAAGVMAKIYQRAQDSELLTLYKELATDDTPMVRRSAAKHLGQFLEQVGYEKGKEFLPVMQQLCRDEQDSVRLLASAALANIGDAFGKHAEWTAQYYLPILKDGSTDMSW